jgi:glucose/arabinose dehydrogenase
MWPRDLALDTHMTSTLSNFVLASTLLASTGCEGLKEGLPTIDVPDLPAIDAGLGTQRPPDEPLRHVFRPESRPVSNERLARLKVPADFALGIFAQELGNARMLALGPDGSIYVTRTEQGDVLRLADRDGDGRAEENAVVATDLPGVHGIAVRGQEIFLATVRSIYRAALSQDGSISELLEIVNDLPDGGQHPRRTLGFGPLDGKLYVSVGSSCDACEESNVEAAALLQMNADGSERRVFASGLRNTIGFAWHPTSGELWGSDHGSDWRGDDQPPDEINAIVEGERYGWPYCFEQQQVDPVIMEPAGMSKAEYCANTAPSVLEYPAHSAPIGWAFYTGTQFPDAYRGDAFVALRGSWNRWPAEGYKLVRVRFEKNRPVEIDDFVSGFLIEDGEAQFARLAGVTVAADGALLFSDDSNGVVYRVTHTSETVAE